MQSAWTKTRLPVRKAATLLKRQGMNWKQRQAERSLPERAFFRRLQKRNCLTVKIIHCPGCLIRKSSDGVNIIITEAYRIVYYSKGRINTEQQREQWQRKNK